MTSADRDVRAVGDTDREIFQCGEQRILMPLAKLRRNEHRARA